MVVAGFQGFEPVSFAGNRDRDKQPVFLDPGRQGVQGH